MAIELDDGTIVRSLPEQVDYLTTANEENEVAIDNLAARLEAAISGVLHYKGSVATYSDLPADAEIGDVYNVIDTGDNYAWTGSEWDKLGGTIDLSNYVDLTSNQTITGLKNFSDKIQFGAATNTIGASSGTLQIKSQIAEFGSGIRPDSDNLRNIGTSALRWKDFYISGTAYMGKELDITDTYSYKLISDGAYLTLKRENVNILQVYDTIVKPYSNNTVDLGTSSIQWKDAYFSGKINMGNEQGLYSSSTSKWILRFNYGNGLVDTQYPLCPQSSNNTDLGTSFRKWKDFYLDGNISNGTDAVTVADLAALITYAKGQGWIS